jgi:hypothetical protein
MSFPTFSAGEDGFGAAPERHRQYRAILLIDLGA